MAIPDSLASLQTHLRTPQVQRGFGLLVTGLVFTVVALNWHPSVIFSGKDWTELFHRVLGGVGIILEVAGMILLVRARAWTRADKS